jgi:uncharacterized protein
MSEPARAQEPTMEEILASIRRIIADDDAAKSPPTQSPPAQVKQLPRAAPTIPPAGKSAPASAAEAWPPARPAPSDLARKPEPPPAAADKPDDLDGMLADAPPAGDVLELTDDMRFDSAAFDTIDGHPDVVFAEAASPEPQSAAEAEQPFAMPDRSLLSPRTAAVVDTAFNSLAHTVLVQNSRTLEDLVREMLKPMLKAWLDDNLPSMVERLVRAEIERVSRGRG